MTKENFKSSTETFRGGKQVQWLYKISKGIFVILEGFGGYFGHFFRFQGYFG